MKMMLQANAQAQMNGQPLPFWSGGMGRLDGRYPAHRKRPTIS